VGGVQGWAAAPFCSGTLRQYVACHINKTIQLLMTLPLDPIFTACIAPKLGAMHAEKKWSLMAESSEPPLEDPTLEPTGSKTANPPSPILNPGSANESQQRNIIAMWKMWTAVVKVSRGPPGPGPGSSNYPPFWPRLLVGGPRLLLQTQ